MGTRGCLAIFTDHLFPVGLKQTSFPLPEFIMAAGFFTVLILERIVLNCREMRGAQEERAPLIPDNRNAHGHSHGTSPDLESSGHHVHVDLQAHSPFRSFMLFLSLSLHSVFEGLAIGLQSTDSKVRRRWVLHLMFRVSLLLEHSPAPQNLLKLLKDQFIKLPLWFVLKERDGSHNRLIPKREQALI